MERWKRECESNGSLYVCEQLYISTYTKSVKEKYYWHNQNNQHNTTVIIMWVSGCFVEYYTQFVAVFVQKPLEFAILICVSGESPNILILCLL